ncbi:hypothetical protein [Rhodobacter sp. SY28-1]|uniref:hypothetical protein n=1 Tax=Rhodobacter sp. SY28-1 TaxID=2562317 RepID=UPI0010BF6B8A|nr:hypothetical protein [Rhodobacter sp. SY28-1]
MPRKPTQKEPRLVTAAESLANEIARLPQGETPEEDQALLKWAAENLHRDLPRTELSWSDDGVLQIKAKGRWGRLYKGSGNPTVANGLLAHLACLGSHKRRTDEEATNFAIAFVDAMQPRDAAEALLLTQMASVHLATMMLARRLNHIENLPQQDSAERALNKLARSYSVQMDTLKRYRSKGQQVVRVERVTVENGAQAIVGNVTHGGRAEDET